MIDKRELQKDCKKKKAKAVVFFKFPKVNRARFLNTKTPTLSIWYDCNLNFNLRCVFLFVCMHLQESIRGNRHTCMSYNLICQLFLIMSFLGGKNCHWEPAHVPTINWLLVSTDSLPTQRQPEDDLYYFCNTISIPRTRNSSTDLYFRQ